MSSSNSENLPVMRHSMEFSLTSSQQRPDSDQLIVLIVLNYTLPRFTPALWVQARLRVCADGGANRLFDELPAFLPDQDKQKIREFHKPDVIIGDLDSIRPEVRQFYTHLGTTVIDQSFDQDSTDLAKCVHFVIDQSLDQDSSDLKESSKSVTNSSLDESCGSQAPDQDSADRGKGDKFVTTSSLDKSSGLVIDKSLDQEAAERGKGDNFVTSSSLERKSGSSLSLKLLVLGALGGRFDHVAANINVLYKFSKVRAVLLGDESLLYFLPRGVFHEICLNTDFEGPECGLIPFGSVAESTTTTGLHWDLTKTRMAFGSLVSTSNLIEGDLVTVCSDSDLIWTVAIRH